VLFFAGGLDPTQSHTISLINYHDQYPNAPSTAPCQVSSAAVDSLSLIMDDTASRDAMLATFNGTLPSSPSSTSSTTAIIAGVLGGLLLLLLVLVVFLGIAWMRLRKEVRSTHYMAPQKEHSIDDSLPDPTPWVSEVPISVQTSHQGISNQPNYAGTPSLPAIYMGSVPREASAQTSSAISPSPASSYAGQGQRLEKRPVRVLENHNSAELQPLSATIEEQDGADSNQREDMIAGAALPSKQQRSRPGSQVLGELVNNLSAVLNGHLHQEYVQREQMERPPAYRDDE